ncbi:GNAT family N-acetyltransferase [Fodinicola acaciae]|uniref:GNAT family N-acetyltransferase n=1 Tax=Fodinicola acaciae TaxID=2681555 RepID=UPI0013D6A039|nr:GNAT family N-acetyltransferase [Fodinicola acaciae]
MTLIRSPYHLEDPIPALADGDVHALPLASILEDVAARVAVARTPVVLSGDCTTALGTAAGLHRAGVEPTLLWLDAHGDFNTPRTSPSGYLGGMVVTMLTGRTDPRELVRGLGLRPLADERTVLVDARDLDPGERDALAAVAVRRCALEELPVPAGPVHLHLDLDIAGDLPAFRYKAPGGPGFDAVVAAVDRVFAGGEVCAFDVAVTVDPSADGCLEAIEAVRRTGWIDDEPLLVRPARLSDVDALVGLWTAAGLRFDAAAVEEELSACLPDGLAFVIASEKRVVASVWGTYDRRRGWIQRLATAPDCRGRGFARRLVAVVEARLAGLGCRHLG